MMWSPSRQGETRIRKVEWEPPHHLRWEEWGERESEACGGSPHMGGRQDERGSFYNNHQFVISPVVCNQLMRIKKNLLKYILEQF